MNGYKLDPDEVAALELVSPAPEKGFKLSPEEVAELEVVSPAPEQGYRLSPEEVAELEVVPASGEQGYSLDPEEVQKLDLVSEGPDRDYGLLKDLGLAVTEGGKELGHALTEVPADIRTGLKQGAADVARATDPTHQARPYRRRAQRMRREGEEEALYDALPEDFDQVVGSTQIEGMGTPNPARFVEPDDPIEKSAVERRADEMQAEAQAEAEELAVERWERVQARMLENPDYFAGRFMENPSVARAAVGAAPSVPGMVLAMVNPVAGAALMTAQEAVPAYTEMRGAGVAPLDAATRTAMFAVGTYAMEKLPFDISPKLANSELARKLGPINTAGLVFAMGAASESGTEVGQEIYQWAVTEGFEGDFAQFMKEADMWEVAASSALMAGGVRAPHFAGAVIDGAGEWAGQRIAEHQATRSAEIDAALRDLDPKHPGYTLNELSAEERAAADAMTPEVVEDPRGPRRSSRPVVVPENGRWVADTPKGETSLEGQWRIVDAEALVSSDQPAFNQDLQPRNRDAMSSRAQVDEIARNLNPNRLLDSPTTDDGAPVTTADGQVISGNGRVMALRNAYAMGTAEGYRDVVAAQAEALGVDISQMQTPVLVRSLPGDTPLERLREVAELSNRPKILERSAAETAKADAELLTPELLATLDMQKPLTEKGNPDFFAAFVGAAKDASLMKKDGSIDPAPTRRRVANAIVAGLAAGHPRAREVITTLTEEAGALGLDKQLGAIARSAPALIKTGQLKPDYDLRTPFGEAMHSLIDFTRANQRLQADPDAKPMSLRDYTGQIDFLSPRDNLSDELFLLLSTQEPESLSQTLDRYNELAGKVDTSTGDMFGVSNASALDLLQKAAAEVEEGIGSQEVRGQRSGDFRVSEDASRPASDARKTPARASRTARANVEPSPLDRYLNPFDSDLRQTFGSDAVHKVKDQFVNRPITNRKTGYEASVSGETLGKMLSTTARNESLSVQAHMLAVGNVDKLFERANLVRERGDRNQDPNIRGMLHFRAQMTFDGNPVGVKMLVKDFTDPNQGKRIYTIQAVEIEDPASWEYGDAQNENSTVLAGSDNSMDPIGSNVNPPNTGSSTAKADVGDVTGPGWPGGRIQDAHRVHLPDPPASEADNPVAPLSRWIGRPLQANLDQVLRALAAPSNESAVEALQTLPVNPDIRIDVDSYAVQGQVDTGVDGWQNAWSAGAAHFTAALRPSELLEAVRAISMPADVYDDYKQALAPLLKDWDGHVLENGTVQFVRPGHTRLMLELPELVRFAEWMGDGKIPAIMRRFRSKAWLGVFRHGDGKGERIELRADIFQLVTPAELGRLREKADAYSQREALTAQEEGKPLTEADRLRVADERYKYLVEEAKREARRNNPKLATKVLTHEIAHWVDHMPDKMINQRGNILGRLGVLTRFLKQSLNVDPAGPHTITKQDRNFIRSQARKQVQETGVKPGDPDFNALVNKRAAALKDIRMRESGIITKAEVQEELRDFIAWWRGTETMEEYFESPAEMYAEAISGYILNPAELGRRAPTTYALIEAHIEGKSNIKKMWDKLQADIENGTNLEDRDRWLDQAFDEGEKVVQVRELARKPEFKHRVDQARMFFDKKYGPIYARAKDLSREKAGELKERIAQYRYRTNHHERFVQDVNLMVMRNLVDNNLTWRHLDKYAFHYRIIHEGADTTDKGRSNIANPGGFDPSTSAESLRKMRRDLGADRFQKLEETRRRLRQLYELHVLKPMREMKVLDADFMEFLESNEAYATFVTHRGEVDAFEQALKSRYGSSVGTGIYKQYGTLQKVRGPASATMEKGINLIDMAYRNYAIQGMVEMLQPAHLDEIVEAEYKWDGRKMAPVMVDNPRMKTVTFLKEGEIKAYNVPPALAEAWESGDHATNVVLRSVNNVFSRPLKSLYVEWPFGIWPLLWMKDVQAYKRLMPVKGDGKWSSAHYFRHIPQAFRAARSMAKGDPNADAQQAMDRGLTIGGRNFMGFLTEEQSVRRIMKRYNQTPVERAKAHQEVDNFLRSAWESIGRGKEWYLRQAQVMERTSKIAGMLYMDKNFSESMPEYQRNQIVRQFSGSPDFLESPTGQPLLDLAMLFYNPWKLGIQQELDSFKGGKARYAAQQLKWTVLPMIIQKAIEFGWLTTFLMVLTGGDEEEAKEIERMHQSRSKYNSMTGLDIPMGWDNREERTVKTLRLPFSEGQRLVAMAVANIMDDIKDDKDATESFFTQVPELLSLSGTQTPGPSPAFDIMGVWSDYLIKQQNPVDSRTNYPILGYHENRARDSRAHKTLWKYTWNQIGGGLIGRFQMFEGDREKTQFEEFINAPGISATFGRVIKVSNRGLYDKLKPEADKAAQEHSRRHLDLQEVLDQGDTPDIQTQSEFDLLKRHMREVMEGDKPLEERIIQSFPTKVEQDAARSRIHEILD